jgi:hypothetical protein
MKKQPQRIVSHGPASVDFPPRVEGNSEEPRPADSFVAYSLIHSTTVWRQFHRSARWAKARVHIMDSTVPTPRKTGVDREICLMISVNGVHMGGRGSGRHWSGQRKGNVELCPPLDVRRLQRDGLLRPGQSFPRNWRRNGQLAATITVTTAADCIVLSYEHFVAGEEWQREQYPVLLEWLPCHYGGRRAWFRCPARGCGRRVAILYGAGIFACRHCHRLAYLSQRIATWNRALRSAQAIRQRLGGTANMYDPFPEKPKGMHWQTYQELRRQHDDANAHSWPGWLRRWKRPSRTITRTDMQKIVPAMDHS